MTSIAAVVILILLIAILAEFAEKYGGPADDSLVRPDGFGFRGAGRGSASGDAFEPD